MGRYWLVGQASVHRRGGGPARDNRSSGLRGVPCRDIGVAFPEDERTQDRRQQTILSTSPRRQKVPGGPGGEQRLLHPAPARPRRGWSHRLQVEMHEAAPSPRVDSRRHHVRLWHGQQGQVLPFVLQDRLRHPSPWSRPRALIRAIASSSASLLGFPSHIPALTPDPVPRAASSHAHVCVPPSLGAPLRARVGSGS